MPQDRDALWSGMHLADMRPPGMQVGFAVPFVMGVGIAAMGVAATRQRRRGNGVPLAGRRPACTVAMVLFAPDDTVSSHAVNAYSGAGGFSHVALDGCEVGHDGEPVLLDCRPSYGMHRRPWSEYSERPHAMVLFDGDTAAELYGCARAKVGQRFDVAGEHCAGALVECLPRAVQLRVEAAPGAMFGMVTPNQIAAAFDARVGHDVWA